ncbi:hypothetical protein FQN54_000722 [Arachnomyces sp. PD_36]|nr:hypothetical protein FQN54_000722 [Arachnomyces sp. PD_36]
MKVTVAIAVSGLVAGAVAQLDGLPECAQSCAMDAIPEECGLDPECVCSSKSFIDSITCCVSDACSTEDQEKTIDFAHNICEPAGVTDIPDSVACNSEDDSGDEEDGIVHGTAVSTGVSETTTDGEIHGTAVSTGLPETTDGIIHGTAVSTGLPTTTGGSGDSPATDAPTGSETTSGSGPAETTGGAAMLVAQNGAVAAAAAAVALFI